MGEASIPVDLFNPGHVFACLGFLEAADVLIGEAEGGFDWSDPIGAHFLLRAAGALDPVKTVLRFLAKANVFSLAPSGTDLGTETWGVPTRTLGNNDPYPVPLPNSPATLPAILETSNAETSSYLLLDHWGDARNKTLRDNAKFWAGAAGYPGAALARDAINLVRDHCQSAASSPFQLSAEQSSSFRFDWRRDYIPLDIGFSLNNHAAGRFATVGYPLVELLAAIGLTNARPHRVSALEYRYAVIGTSSNQQFFDPLFLRATLGGSKLPFPQRSFRMLLGWPGKENQARCIITVTEEIPQ